MMPSREHYRGKFWKSLPVRSYLKILLAIFFTFSSIGFITDLFNGGRLPKWELFFFVVFSGLMGVGYGHAAMRNWKLFPVVLGVQLSISFLIPDNSFSIELDRVIQHRLLLDGIGLLLCMVLGYMMFVLFISGEGVRQMRLQTEMDLAREMHEVLVPELRLRQPGFAIYGKSVPASEVGGDLVDVYRNGDTLTCLVADISGHGVAAALLMGMFKSAMHTHLRRNPPLAEALNEVNQTLYRLKKRTTFLTCACLGFYPDGRTEYSVAGHLPILHYRAGSAQVEQLTLRQIPLAVQADYPFATRSIIAEPGDWFVLVTDGLTEVFNDAGEEFDLSVVEEMLIRHHTADPETLYQAIMRAVRSHGRQQDDQTLMLIRCE